MSTQLAEKLDQRWTLEGYLNAAGMKDVPQILKGLDMPEEVFGEPFSVMPHQITGLNLMFRNSRFGLYDEPGVGKSIPAMAYALAQAAHKNKVLMVMPPVLVWQMWEAFDIFFPGCKDRFKLHQLSQGFWPTKITKAKAQKIRRELYKKEMTRETIKSTFGVDDGALNLVANMPELQDVPFRKAEVMEIRAVSYKVVSKAALAKKFGCSEGSITALRNQTFLEDLFDDWRYNGWPDILLMSHQRYLTVADRLAKRYRALIVDEAHLVGMLNERSKMHRRVQAFCNVNQKEHGDVGLILMTGTPASNHIGDLYGLISLTNPKAYESKASFKSLHLDVHEIERESASGKKVKFDLIMGYRNLDYLNAAFYANARRLRKEQVFKMDQPRIIRDPIRLSPEHMDAYEALVKELVLMSKEEVIDLSSQQKLRMAAAQAAVAPEAAIPGFRGMNHAKDWLQELLLSLSIGPQEKIVIFAHFVSTVELIAKHWLRDYNCAVINSTTDTTKEVKKFLYDDACTVAVANPKSGGVGLNLQSVCRYVAFFEPTSVPGEFLQAAERVYRKGQKRLVTIYLPHVFGTVLPKKIDEMLGKLTVTAQVQRDSSSLLSELLGH